MSIDLESQVRDALRDAVASRNTSTDAWSRLAERRARSVRSRRAALLSSTALATVVAVVAISVVSRDGQRRDPQPIANPPTTSAALSSGASLTSGDPITATIANVSATALVYFNGDIWAADSNAGELIRVNTADNRVVSRHAVGNSPGPSGIGLVASGSALWALSGGVLQRVDPTSGQTTALGDGDSGNASELAFGQDSLWVVCCTGESLQQIDAATGRVMSTTKFPTQFPGPGVAVGHGAVWVNATGGGDGVQRYDPTTKEHTTTSLVYSGGNLQGNIAVTDDAVWAETGDAVVRIDPISREVTATVPLPPNSTVLDMTGVGGTLWVVGNMANKVWRIDARTGQITGVVDIRAPQAVVATADAVWVSAGSSLVRFDPSRLASPAPAVDSPVFEVDGMSATVPPGWFARSLGTRILSSRGRSLGSRTGIQLSTFTFLVRGAEDPIVGMKSDDALLTIKPDDNELPAAVSSASLALSADDLVTDGSAPVSRSIARRALVYAGLRFIVEAHFGKADVNIADFSRVNAVLAAVRIEGIASAPAPFTPSSAQASVSPPPAPESVNFDGPVQIAPTLAEEASLPPANTTFPTSLDLTKTRPTLVEDPIERALAIFQPRDTANAGVLVLGDDGRLRSLGVPLEPGGDGANKAPALTTGSLRVDGQAAAFGQPDGVIVVDLLTGTPKRYEVLGTGDKYQGHSEYIEHVSWHPDGKTLFLSGRDSYLLDLATGQTKTTTAEGWESLFTDSGELLALGSRGIIRYDSATGAQLTAGGVVPATGYSRPVSRGARVARLGGHEGSLAIPVVALGTGAVERMLLFKGAHGRDTGCCRPVGWLDDDTLIIDSLYAAPTINRLLAWNLREGVISRLTELSGSAAMSFARL